MSIDTMAANAKVERPRSLTAIAKDSIRRAIVDGELAFGTQLSESALALRLGVSKTPVREALLQLKLEGLVEIQPQSGTFVLDLTEDQVREICRFREIIELSALELAIQRDAKDLAQHMQAALKVPKAVSSTQAAPRDVDARFHGAILECCGNTYLQSAYQLIADKIQSLRSRLSSDDTHVDACHDTHSGIVALVREGNVKKACAELRSHIRSTEESYIRASRGPRGA
ncbi:GntR family transcriptional regulator [Pararobbsia silviterrae]|nr:GntR family transcriptional regulator [Pararobbsia silviterrae]